MVRLAAKWMARGSAVLGGVASIALFVLVFVMDVTPAVVRSSSMEPNMPVGSLALAAKADPALVRAGDVISFHPVRDPGTVVSHRVIEVSGDGASLAFRTKGDANEDPDQNSVPAANVTGRVIFDVPYVGYGLVTAKRYVKTKLGFAFLVALPTLGLIGMAARDLGLMASAGGRRVARRKMRSERVSRRRQKARLATVW